MRITIRFALLSVPLLLGLACDDNEITAPELIARIDVLAGDCPGLEVGETCQLEAVARTADGTVIESPDITWFTPDILIANVDFQGRVTGVAPGQAEIFAQSVPGPNACQQEVVVCDSQIVGVLESPPPIPGPQP